MQCLASPFNRCRPTLTAMRKAMKFFHTLAACGIIGGIAVYAALLSFGPAETPEELVWTRGAILIVANIILLPSLGVVIVSGLLSIAFHHPFHDKRWVWIKALLGISMFEAVLGVIGAKARSGEKLAREIAEGSDKAPLFAEAIQYEWHALAVIMALSLVNVALGVWRPLMRSR